MKITTREVFQWNKDSKEYESIECESYDYSGEIAKCDCNESDSWWFGTNSLWCRARNKWGSTMDENPGLNPFGADKGSIGFQGFELGWDASDTGSTSYFFSDRPGNRESEILKYGIIAVAAYMLIKK